MTIDLDKLEQLARAATPGPYRYRDDTSAKLLGSTVENEDRVIVAMHVSVADAAFIAAANPAAVLELVQRVRAAEDALAMIATLETEERSMLAPRAALGDAITTALPWRRAVEWDKT